MGITNVSWASLQKVMPSNLINKYMVELGDQEFVLPGRLDYCGFEISLSKNYYDLIGVSHTTIDWHGKNGALIIDMSKPITSLLFNRFDILTDFGFSEHVKDQYQNWKNIHDIVKPGGLMIHELPGQPMFPGHGECPWFTTDFFECMAKKQNYEIVEIRFHQHDYYMFPGRCVWAVLIKTNTEFMSLQEFQELDLRYN